MPTKVILEVVSGPIQGKVFSFESHDTFLFGRKTDCHAHLSGDGYVSRHHFILEVNPPDARVRDLGSQNGTFVNAAKYGGRAPGEAPELAAERQYPEVDLKHGDRVTVGHTTFQVKIELPPSCCQCGEEIAEADRPQAEWMTGSFLCQSCRDKVEVPRRTPNVVEIVCQRCGKDVSAEVGSSRTGQYVCRQCQSQLMSEGGGLRRLIQQAASKVRDRTALSIDGYEIGEPLGKGGMGVVYRASRKSDGQPVAVKVMLAKIAVREAMRKMFLREIEVMRQLRHPHIVSLLASGSAGSAFYFVMEFCNEGSLDRLIKRRGGKLPLRMAAPIILQCLDGLEYAHQLGFVHRDLKPQNILLDTHSGRTVARITDFGLAKNFQAAGLSGMTATGAHAGTYHFMPREQLLDFKYAQPISDLWSTAATLYNALTGEFPLDFANKRDPMEVILNSEPVPVRRLRPDIPPALAEVIDQALSPDKTERYQTASELKAAIGKCLGRSETEL